MHYQYALLAHLFRLQFPQTYVTTHNNFNIIIQFNTSLPNSGPMALSLLIPLLYSHPVKVLAPYLLPTNRLHSLGFSTNFHFLTPFFTNLFSDQDAPLYFFVLFISYLTIFMSHVCPLFHYLTIK
jgi:hypothetical protein